MTIEDFCTEYAVPRTRTTRSIRALANEVLAREVGVSDGEVNSLDLTEHHLGPTVQNGVRIEKPAGHERFSYEVTHPEELFRWLVKRHGHDLLRSNEIEQLLDCAEFLLDVIDGEANWSLEPKGSYRRERRDKDEIAEDLKAILRKVGRA
jgi:hypothetical protein